MSVVLPSQNQIPFGYHMKPPAPTPVRRVEAPAQTSQSSSSTDYGLTKGNSAENMRKIPEAFDEHILTGPPPAFQASLLEVESHLDVILRRLEAERQIERSGVTGATSPGADKQATTETTDQAEETPQTAETDESAAPETAEASGASEPES